MGSLTEKEAAHCNRLLAHAETLVNARGQHDDRQGRYRSGPWQVAWEYSASGCDLEIKHRDETTMRCHWSDPTEPANAYSQVEPGSWQSAFLALPAAHA